MKKSPFLDRFWANCGQFESFPVPVINPAPSRPQMENCLPAIHQQLRLMSLPFGYLVIFRWSFSEQKTIYSLDADPNCAKASWWGHYSWWVAREVHAIFCLNLNYARTYLSPKTPWGVTLWKGVMTSFGQWWSHYSQRVGQEDQTKAHIRDSAYD